MTIEQTHRLLSLAVEGGRIGTWYWRIETDELEWSELCREQLALPPGAAPSFAHFYGVLHPEDRDRVEGLITRAIEDQADHYQAEYRVVHPDGSMRWISAPGRLYRDAEGRPQALAGILIDITERKQAEARLGESMELFRRVYEHAPTGIAITDLQGQFECCNPAYCALLGYTEEELRAMQVDELVHPEDREENMAVIREMLDGTISEFVIENRYVRKDGRCVWVRKQASWLPDAGGQPAHLMALVTDLTERRQTEQALRDNRRLLDLALDGAELGTWDTDIASGMSLYDARYCAMLGYRTDEIEPTHQAWLNLVHPDDRDLVSQAVRRHLSGETRLYEAEYRLRHKAGHWVWVLARGKVTYDAGGRPVRATGTHLDITHRKQLALEGADLLHRIEALIAGLDRGPGHRADGTDGLVRGQVRLSARHREVLALIAEGCTSAQIAERLNISRQTATTHRRDLMRKLGLRNKAELIRYALTHELGAP